jgi:hypothetical protein
MAWRPTEYFLEGELDNTTPGKVIGWMRFAGMKDKVAFDLDGDFHRDIRGAKIRLKNTYRGGEVEAAKYMEGFSQRQTGKAGDITAGRPPQDYVDYPYIEWYSNDNGRVVVELDLGQVEVIGAPIPPVESDPISRKVQGRNMTDFLSQIVCELDTPPERSAGTDVAATARTSKKASVCHRPAATLLTEEIRRQIPPLYSQEGKGGKAVIHVKFFTPDSSWTWYATEFDGQDLFFGLVEGQFKELGYFSLSELESAKGPMGLHIERDLHWNPTRLCEIAPEMFRDSADGGEQ